MSKQEFTEKVVDKFEREFAKGITEYAAQSKTSPCFIFFPMNAIQFGSSDLKSAWRIMRHLGPDIDFRLWEADASLDGVVSLLRKLDVVIAMRFHAAIFALSQGKKVIGIDYVIGKRDKVAAVLSDAGFPDNVTRIDQLEASWLVEKLTTLLPKG
jgi:polysaccharide pyruvyl transferase WcaK-like protein